MDYVSLSKIYYKYPDSYESEYKNRFTSPFTKHISLIIQQFGHKNAYPIFYCYTEEIANLQDKIMTDFFSLYKLIDEIPGAGITQFLYTRLVEEIKSSNDIEGVHSTRKEIRAALNSNEKKRLSGIVNKYEKIINNEEIPLKTCQDIRNLFNDFLADEIKMDDPENLPDGVLFRKNSVDIISETQKILHRGVFPEAKIIQTMDSALSILNDDTIPIFIRIAIFHYLFGYIHPFYDGNGRMSRFITSYLLSKQLHPTIGLQVSILIKKNRKKYYDLFQEADSELNRGDLTPFIIGTLQFIHAAISYTKDVLQKKWKQYLSYSNCLDLLEIDDRTTYKIYDVLLQAAVFSYGGATIDEIAYTIKKTKSTVYSRLKTIPPDRYMILKRTRPYHYRLNLKFLDKKSKNIL